MSSTESDTLSAGSRPRGNGEFFGDGSQPMADAARDVASSAKQQAESMYRGAASAAKEQAESMYRDASSVAAETSGALDDAADSLERSGHETLSQAAAALSERVRTFSDYLEGRKLEDLIGDARALAQRNPGLFVAGGVALGFVLSRFLKSSASQSNRSI